MFGEHLQYYEPNIRSSFGGTWTGTHSGESYLRVLASYWTRMQQTFLFGMGGTGGLIPRQRETRESHLLNSPLPAPTALYSILSFQTVPTLRVKVHMTRADWVQEGICRLGNESELNKLLIDWKGYTFYVLPYLGPGTEWDFQSTCHSRKDLLQPSLIMRPCADDLIPIYSVF